MFYLFDYGRFLCIGWLKGNKNMFLRWVFCIPFECQLNVLIFFMSFILDLQSRSLHDIT